jgi:hypothetical protein
MKMGTDVGKIVDADPRAPSTCFQRLVHRALMTAQRPRASCFFAVKREVHRPPCADRPFEFASTSTNVAAVFEPTQLAANRKLRKEMQLGRQVGWTVLSTDTIINRY